MDRPTPWPYWRAKAASSSGKPNSWAVGQTLDDVGGRGTGPHQRDRPVHVLAGPLVRVVLRRARRADRERAVVAGPVAVEAVQDVEEGGVARPDEPVGVDVRMRRAPLPRDGVDALDVLGPEVVEHLGDEPDGLVLAHPGPQELVEARRMRHPPSTPPASAARSRPGS